MLSKSCLGIDIGSSHIKIVEVMRQGRGRFKTSRLGRIATPKGAMEHGEIVKPELLGLALAELVKALGLKSKKATVSLIGKSIVTRQIRMPIMPSEELAEAIKWEVERYIPMSIDDLVFDFAESGLVDGDGGPQQQVLLVAAPKKEVYGFYEMFKGAGIQPIAVETPPFALRRVFCDVTNVNVGILSCLDIGKKSSTVVVLKEKNIQFVRNIPIGGDQLLESMSFSSGIAFQEAAVSLENMVGFCVDEPNREFSPEDVQSDMLLRTAFAELVSEVRRSLDFYKMQSRDAGVSHLIVSGGVSGLPGIAQFFGSEFGIPVGLANLGDLVGEGRISTDLRQKLTNDMSVALGLALREVYHP